MQLPSEVSLSDARPSLVENESSSKLPRSPSGRLLSSSSRELRSRISSAGDKNKCDGGLSSNGHLQMRSHRPSLSTSFLYVRAWVWARACVAHL